eukprot:1045175-Pleurochrysis_carterae.AAC.1
MFKELKDELANLHDAYDADEHEKEIERMRDDILLDNCTGQKFADKSTSSSAITTPTSRSPTLARG